MNKLYIIVPLVLTIAFGGLYMRHRGEAAVKAQEELAALTKAQAEAAAQKAEAERQAKADADKREATRLAEEKKKEDDKRAKWDSESKRIADDTATYATSANDSSISLRKLEDELTALRAEKDLAIQAGHDLAREVELARINRRNAELEIQRLVEMVARQNSTTAALSFAR